VTKGLQLIPTDIIEAWAKGEYYVGDIPSISYARLGTALFLRSWYTYESPAGDPNKLAGVAKIDITGSFLFVGGIRLVDDGKNTAVFWKTQASHFANDKEVIWFHSVFNPDFGQPDAAAIRSKYVPASWLRNGKAASATDCFGMTPVAWNALLDTLRTDFDSDIERLQQQCPPERIDDGMLRYSIIPAQDQTHRCEYYQFYSAANGERSLIKGVSLFKKTFKQ